MVSGVEREVTGLPVRFNNGAEARGGAHESMERQTKRGGLHQSRRRQWWASSYKGTGHIRAQHRHDENRRVQGMGEMTGVNGSPYIALVFFSRARNAVGC